MSASNNYTDPPIVLVADLWTQISVLKGIIEASIPNLDRPPARQSLTQDLIKIHTTMLTAVHRLTFLEMVTMGMSYEDKEAFQLFKRNLDAQRAELFAEAMRSKGSTLKDLLTPP